MRTLKNGININPGRVHKIGINLPGLHNYFHFPNNVISGSGHHGIDVARRLAIDEIAPAIAFPRLDELDTRGRVPGVLRPSNSRFSFPSPPPSQSRWVCKTRECRRHLHAGVRGASLEDSIPVRVRRLARAARIACFPRHTVEIIFLTWWVCRSTPTPQSSTPPLLRQW